jgi:hypothetical protein
MECFSCKARATSRIVRNTTGDFSEACDGCASPYRTLEGFTVTSIPGWSAPVDDLPSAPAVIIPDPPSPESAPVPGPVDDTIPIS